MGSTLRYSVAIVYPWIHYEHAMVIDSICNQTVSRSNFAKKLGISRQTVRKDEALAVVLVSDYRTALDVMVRELNRPRTRCPLTPYHQWVLLKIRQEATAQGWGNSPGDRAFLKAWLKTHRDNLSFAAYQQNQSAKSPEYQQITKLAGETL